MSEAVPTRRTAFLAELQSRLLPAHRVVPSALRVRLAAAWTLALVGPGTLLLILGVLVTADVPRQLALDTLASLGLGTVRAEARVAGLSCSFHQGTGRLGLSEHRCGVTVREGRDAIRLEIRTGDAPTRAEAGPVVTLSGQPAIRWSSPVMWSRWGQLLPLAIPFIALLPLTIVSLLAIRRLSRQVRAIAAGEPRPADLLRRRGGTSPRDPVRWDIVYDHDGRRRLATMETSSWPLLLDAMATRGVVLAAPDGSAELLQAQGWPLSLDPPTAAWLTGTTEEMRRAARPRAPRLATVADRLAEEPERDYARAFDALWHAETDQGYRDAFTQLQAAAAGLEPTRIDTLLAELRACLPPPEGTA